ncbi:MULTISPECIES: hypothetical protein [unclassified Rickettsia]|uniref:hypothetical protein n=1 Tax=unclassified Rickettsia TaxID=114295 RepID=UPI003132D7F9
MTQPFFNVRTVVGLTTVSRKSLNKKTGCRGQAGIVAWIRNCHKKGVIPAKAGI